MNLVAHTCFAAEYEAEPETIQVDQEDRWIETDKYFIRVHNVPRRRTFFPRNVADTIDESLLTGRRLTKQVDVESDVKTSFEDVYTETAVEEFDPWVGETYFEKVPAADQWTDTMRLEQILEEENDFLSQIPLPGVPKDERERRLQWSKVPRRIRAAVRRLHKQFGHVPRSVLVSLVKAAKLPEAFVTAARSLKCLACETTQKPPQTNKVSLPTPYERNHTIGIDVFDLHDQSGQVHQFLNILDIGTRFQSVMYLKPGKGTPSAQSCCDAFLMGWVKFQKWPSKVLVDRGLHNRGVFAKMFGGRGISITPIALESPEMIGTVVSGRISQKGYSK